MKIRKTPLFWIVLIIGIVGLPAGIYGLTLSGGASLLGFVILLFVFASMIGLTLEQLLVALFQPKVWGVLLIDIALSVGVGAVVSPFLG